MCNVSLQKLCTILGFLVDSFHDTISEVTEKHVPLRKLSKRQVRLVAKPWITNGIRASIRNKNNLYKMYLKERYKGNMERY